MKVAILAGGYGTRLSEETAVKPKPMVEIGGRPILWHIMKYYASFGFKEFVVLGGYKVESIREYFYSYKVRNSDFTISLSDGEVEWLGPAQEDWKVTVLDTGIGSMTGGRIKAAERHLSGGTFLLTYGDGVCDVNLGALIDRHHALKSWCTLTAVAQPGRYGALRIEDNGVVGGFREKGARDGGLINGGFFVCEPEIFGLIDGPQTTWEAEPMDRMVEVGRLGSYEHTGFWQSMDSLRDKVHLEEIWASGSAPWKAW